MLIDLLKSAVIRLPIPEPALPVGRRSNLPVRDAEPEVDGQILADNISSALFISYKDVKGDTSRRRISIRSISQSSAGAILINAYCYERKAARCFRADRITEAVDLTTGEILDTAALLKGFGIEDEEDFGSDPYAPTKEALRKCRYALNVLTYLARCDGRFHHKEEDIIIHYLVSECFNCVFDDAFLLARIRSHYPDMDAFFDSLDYLQENAPGSLKKIGKYAAQLVQADGVISREETELMAELHGYLAGR